MTNPKTRPKNRHWPAGPTFSLAEGKNGKIASPSERRDGLCSQEQPHGKPLDLVTPPADHRLKSGRY